MEIGLYQTKEPLALDDLKLLENSYGVSIHIISVYRAWNNCSIKDDQEWLMRLKQSPRDLMLTWEPWSLNAKGQTPSDQPSFSYNSILSGMYDQYIKDFARQLSTFPQNIYLRPMHEMNGNWYPWCGTANGNKPGDFIRVWHYIRNIVSKISENVKWVWSPYALSYPPEKSNSIQEYFPGDKAIDWTGIDGYNWGTSGGTFQWQNFEEIFGDAYDSIVSISSKPMMIAEIASSEEGGDKGNWIKAAAGSLKKRFPAVQKMIWFDVKKECDWRISSSDRSSEAFRMFGKLIN